MEERSVHHDAKAERMPCPNIMSPAQAASPFSRFKRLNVGRGTRTPLYLFAASDEALPRVDVEVLEEDRDMLVMQTERSMLRTLK